MDQIVGYVGRRTINSVNHIINLFAFTYRIFFMLFKRQKAGRAIIRRIVLEQIYFTAVQSLYVIIPAALIIGSMLIVQFARVSGQYDLGKTTVLLILRELGPAVTALVVLLRSATAVTSEVCYMKVLHEIDALEMNGIDPIRIICVPRLIGIITAVLCLFIVFDIVSIIGGYIIVWTISYIPMGNFLEQIGKAITATDIIVGIVKAVCFGIVITVTSLYHGFTTKKRISHIPAVLSIASVECFFYCLVINFIISIIFYL